MPPEAYVRSTIAAMSGYTPGEQPQTGRIIKLNTNENPYPASPAVGEAITGALSSGLSAYPDATARLFRRRAAEVLDVDPDWILCGNGSDDILTIVTRAFVGQGERLRLPYPSYILYRTLAELQGAIPEEVSFDRHWTLPAAFGESRADLRLVCLPNPNSPSGTIIGRDDILALADRLPCPLLVDEAYVDFAEFNCLDLVARNEKILVARSLSKSYALAGLRFGFLVAQPQIVEQLLKVKDSYNCDTLSIAGATAAIGDRAWQIENRGKIVATRSRMTGALRQLGFRVEASQANFVWCVHETCAAEPLYRRLRDQGVLVRYMRYVGWGDGLRISVGTDPQVDTCLQLLDRALQDEAPARSDRGGGS